MIMENIIIFQKHVTEINVFRVLTEELWNYDAPNKGKRILSLIDSIKKLYGTRGECHYDIIVVQEWNATLGYYNTPKIEVTIYKEAKIIGSFSYSL